MITAGRDISIYDLATGKFTKIKTPAALKCLVLVPNTSFLMTCDDSGEVRLYDSKTLQLQPRVF